MKSLIGFNVINLMIGGSVTKICMKCGDEKPITSFKSDKRGTRNVCIQCRNYHSGIARRGKAKWLKEGKEIRNQ